MKTSTPHVTLPDGEWTVGLCRYRVDIVQILRRYYADIIYTLLKHCVDSVQNQDFVESHTSLDGEWRVREALWDCS